MHFIIIIIKTITKRKVWRSWCDGVINKVLKVFAHNNMSNMEKKIV